MTKKNTIGTKLKAVANKSGISQKELSENVGISTVQLSRFFNGVSDLNLENFIALLKYFDIDLEKELTLKAKRAMELEEELPENVNECLLALFKGLDPLGKQTYLKQLLWANQVINRSPISARALERIERNLNSI